ncbi:MAG: hypothetical protein ACRDGR_00375 [bacterium]
MPSPAIRLAAAAVGVMLSAAPAAATVQGFGGYPAGTIVYRWGTAMAHWPGFTISAVWNNNGPNAAILFDSAHPTSEDVDLGAPNRDFGGPGIGIGGKFGMPGENSVPLGNLLIIAETMGDFNHDGRVDIPDDDSDGGCIRLDFHPGNIPVGVTVLDVDVYTRRYDYLPDALRVTFVETAAGDNTVVRAQFPSTSYQRIEICFEGSGAIAQVEYGTTVPVEETTWGRVKSMYR